MALESSKMILSLFCCQKRRSTTRDKEQVKGENWNLLSPFFCSSKWTMTF